MKTFRSIGHTRANATTLMRIHAQPEILESLQLPKERAQRRMLKAADGNLISAYLFRLPVQIADIRIRASIAFSDKLKIGFNLLGRQTIFAAFEEIAFNEREKKIFSVIRTDNRCLGAVSRCRHEVFCLAVKRRMYRAALKCNQPSP